MGGEGVCFRLVQDEDRRSELKSWAGGRDQLFLSSSLPSMLRRAPVVLIGMASSFCLTKTDSHKKLPFHHNACKVAVNTGQVSRWIHRGGQFSVSLPFSITEARVKTPYDFFRTSATAPSPPFIHWKGLLRRPAKGAGTF